MTKEIYEKLRKEGEYEALWLDLLNASGFAGILRNGNIVDRRYYPEANPISENRMFGIAKPKELQEKTEK